MSTHKNKSAIFRFFVVLFVFTAFACIVPQSFAATSTENKTDFIVMYKQYFKDMTDKKYKEVWDVTTVYGKETIAKLIAKSAKKEIDFKEVMQMLDADTKNIRTIFFDSFTNDVPLKKIQDEGVFTVKSSSPDEVIITIIFEDEPKDFKILKEDGVWKINFFYDIMN